MDRNADKGARQAIGLDPDEYNKRLAQPSPLEDVETVPDTADTGVHRGLISRETVDIGPLGRAMKDGLASAEIPGTSQCLKGSDIPLLGESGYKGVCIDDANGRWVLDSHRPRMTRAEMLVR